MAPSFGRTGSWYWLEMKRWNGIKYISSFPDIIMNIIMSRLLSAASCASVLMVNVCGHLVNLVSWISVKALLYFRKLSSGSNRSSNFGVLLLTCVIYLCQTSKPNPLSFNQLYMLFIGICTISLYNNNKCLYFLRCCLVHCIVQNCWPNSIGGLSWTCVLWSG